MSCIDSSVGMNKKIAIVTPSFPPTSCGIADYSLNLAKALTCFDVSTLTAEENFPRKGEHEAIACFRRDDPRSLLDVPKVIALMEPEWMVVQYCPTAYGGRRGVNPYLHRMIGRVRRRSTRTRIALVVHESFVEISNARRLVLQATLYYQLLASSRHANLLVVPVKAWMSTVGRFAPGKRVIYAPVGSNIPLAKCNRDQVRVELGIPSSEPALGLLGRLPEATGMEAILAAIRRIRECGRVPTVVYVGPDTSRAEACIGQSARLLTGSNLDRVEVSRRLQVCDVYLAPFDEGVSTRRTSLMAALCHGLPIVGTRGSITDATLLSEDGSSLLLVDRTDVHGFAASVYALVTDSPKALRLSLNARRLYEDMYSWQQVSRLFRTEFMRNRTN